MSNYHYKVGEGFTIRYGASEGICWSKTPGSQTTNGQTPTVGFGAADPIGMAIEAAKAAGLIKLPSSAVDLLGKVAATVLLGPLAIAFWKNMAKLEAVALSNQYQRLLPTWN